MTVLNKSFSALFQIERLAAGIYIKHRMSKNVMVSQLVMLIYE
jgi:hypothetical protein